MPVNNSACYSWRQSRWEMTWSLHPAPSSLGCVSQHARLKPRCFRLPFYYSSVRLRFQASGWEQVAGVQALVDSLFSKVLQSTPGESFLRDFACAGFAASLRFILTPTSKHPAQVWQAHTTDSTDKHKHALSLSFSLSVRNTEEVIWAFLLGFKETQLFLSFWKGGIFLKCCLSSLKYLQQ